MPGSGSRSKEDGHSFGWCITGHHGECRISFDWYDGPVVCACSCHASTLTT